jgi:hypothetical protein
VNGLRRMAAKARAEPWTQSPAAKQSPNRLDLHQLTKVKEELRLDCAGRTSSGDYRPASDVAWSLQRFLIFAMLICIPGAAPPPHLPAGSISRTLETGG